MFRFCKDGWVSCFRKTVQVHPLDHSTNFRASRLRSPVSSLWILLFIKLKYLPVISDQIISVLLLIRMPSDFFFQFDGFVIFPRNNESSFQLPYLQERGGTRQPTGKISFAANHRNNRTPITFPNPSTQKEIEKITFSTMMLLFILVLLPFLVTASPQKQLQK